MKTFILADNQDITRKGLEALIKEQEWTNPLIYTSHLEELQQKLKLYPESIVILDYSLFDFSSAEHLLLAVEGSKNTIWILFSEELSLPFLRQVLYHAATDSQLSVVLKKEREECITEALQNALQNRIFYSESVRASLIKKAVPPQKRVQLTQMEKIVLREIAQGKTTKTIALEKNISFHTVNTHRKNIFRKIEVNNIQEAIRYAIKAGLLDTSDYYI